MNEGANRETATPTSTTGANTVLWNMILQRIFHQSFAVLKATSAYNRRFIVSEDPPHVVRWVALSIATGILVGAAAGVISGMLAVVLPYLTLVAMNIVVSAVMDASENLSHRVAKRYLRRCVLYRTRPAIHFILFLRPFSLEASLRLRLFDPMDTIYYSGELHVHSYLDGRPVVVNENTDVIGVVQGLSSELGVWVQAGMTEPSWPAIGVRLSDTEWEAQVVQLCEAARFIVLVPLFGIDFELPAHVKFGSLPPPEIVELLRKKDHEGLRIEMSLMANSALATKTMFLLPCNLSRGECIAICKLIADHGFVWPTEYSCASKNHVRLYRCVRKSEPMIAVEIGPYTKRFSDEGLGPNQFALVSGNPWNDWTKISGNALEYLLVDDEGERRRRWSHVEFCVPGLSREEFNRRKTNGQSLFVGLDEVLRDRR